MTMTSFPWENKTSQSFPWEKRESSQYSYQNRGDNSSSYKWQTPQNGAPSYHWQSAAPTPNSGMKYPWDSGSGHGYMAGSLTNPFDVKKTSFPWEKSAVNSTSKSDLFVFGREEPKSSSYSSMFREQQQAERDKPPETKPAPGTYSSFFNENKKSLFPWEKNKDVQEEDKKPDPDSLEAKMSEYLKLTPPGEYGGSAEKDKQSEEVEIKVEKAVEKTVPSPKTPKKKSSPKKSPKSGRKKSSSKEENVKKEEKEEENTPNIEVKVKISTDQEDEEAKLKEEGSLEKSQKSKAPSPKTPSQAAADEKPPITSPKTTLSRSSSLTRLAAKNKTDRVKSAPPVPKHINRKSEMLARSYTSAYAKPKISPTKKEEEKKEEEKPKLSYRREQSISEWVYPSPPEPVDWKIRSEQGLPIEAPQTTTLNTQSELNLDSTSLREAAFQKWIAKKKENKTFKKSDLVTVIHDKEEMPSAEEIRQKRFEEWYRSRAVEADKKVKEKNKADTATKIEADELKEQKLKNEAIARRLWEEKDKERKQKIRAKRQEEEKKKIEREKELEEKKKNADKTFNNWKTNKDPKLKDEARKKRLEEKKKKEQERDEKEMKEIESQKSFKAWKEAKDQEIRDKKTEADRQKRLAEQREMRQKREKEEATSRAVEEWNARKERDESKITIPQHVSPWKNGPGKQALVSRDEMIMANIKHKKNRQRQGSGRGARSVCDSETVTEVEFVK